LRDAGSRSQDRIAEFPRQVRDEITCGAWLTTAQPEQLTIMKQLFYELPIGTMVEDHATLPTLAILFCARRPVSNSGGSAGWRDGIAAKIFA